MKTKDMKKLEKNTDLIVWDHFSKYNGTINFIVEPKKTQNQLIQTILKNASKKETENVGFPEYIVTFSEYPSLVIVIEDKANFLDHESKRLNQPIKYAVDGAIHYGKKLSKEFDVISIGVSGTSIESLLVTHYLHLKNNDTPIKLDNFSGLMSPEEYIKFYTTDERKNRQDFENLLKFSDKLNDDLFKKYKIKEDERAILIAGILVSLKNNSFKISYKESTLTEELCTSISTAVRAQLTKNKLNFKYIDMILGHFNFICQSPKFREDVSFLRELINTVDTNINCYIQNTQYQDVLGSLYVKFLEKANGDRQLGIVLTPEHVTRFMCRLCELTDESIILDNCAGTGGFLLSASKFNSQIMGIEYEPKMFTLMVLNMMIHNLPLNNVWQGDSLMDSEILSNVVNAQPNAGILNPPYDGREWEFIEKNLKVLKKNSKCVAIVPMSLVTSMDAKNLNYRKRILENHQLEAVFSMPNELFFNSNTSVVTCVVVLTAHVKHSENKEVYFGYYKNDGFEKRKKFGRYDINNTWDKIENEWFWNYKNKYVKPEYSINKKVKYDDEWCAESFLETDYNAITENEFENMLKKYAAFKILN
jgi:type I restriction-modification system DNA methylase subunit